MNKRVKIDTKSRTQKTGSNTYKTTTVVKVDGRKIGTETTTVRFR